MSTVSTAEHAAITTYLPSGLPIVVFSPEVSAVILHAVMPQLHISLCRVRVAAPAAAVAAGAAGVVGGVVEVRMGHICTSQPSGRYHTRLREGVCWEKLQSVSDSQTLLPGTFVFVQGCVASLFEFAIFVCACTIPILV